MPLDAGAALDRLRKFDFSGLFTQDLGWDLPPPDVKLSVGGKGYALRAVAQKRGLVVYEYGANGTEPIPDSTLGRKIDRELTKQAREHIIVFTDADRTTQVWQWVKREEGAALACRRHTYHAGQPGESLLQKLDKLFVSLDEEEDFSVVDAAGRVKAAFDVERVTKRFFERFQAEHEAFLGFVKGIREQGDREWYASLMLNRLMFIYFIQKRRFLDGDVDYLRNRLAHVKLTRGKDKFHSFYRAFLLRLFHEGLGKPPHEREPELEELLGEVPYLNGGLFDQHELERTNPDLEIPDRAFERVFAFFEEFDWTLEPRPAAFYAANPRAREEINPDILGYIFEKYINQKEMGAYYTKEDITDYIAKNTIIPYLLDTARKDCAVAFGADRPLWRLLQETPDAYLYRAVRQGVIDNDGQIIPLPDEIAVGLDDVSRRGGWNKSADAPFALPTETWREHVARRRRCLELREKLAAGEVYEINDLVTYNLDIRRFALDAVEYCEGPEFLRAFYRVLERVSVLDPTCGSGAFLFAALNVLEPLYEACLDRMREFVDDADASGTKRRKDAVADFRQTLDRVAAHPSREYFIHKSIVVNNLFGVDLMEEAVEICKLRLFLKLVAQVDKVRHLEPLPDIDFNIRAGNTLVGFTSLDEIRKSQEGTLGFSAAEVARIETDARAVDQRFRDFRTLQIGGGGRASSSAEISAAKAALRKIQADVARRLDIYLAGDYGIDAAEPKQGKTLSAWQRSHRPFHWFVEFYGAVSRGGFDIIIGNPPYIELRALTEYEPKGYECESASNTYALVIERGFRLSHTATRQGYIVPVSSISTDRYARLQQLLHTRDVCYSAYDDRPSRLFDGLEHIRLTIHLIGRQRNGETDLHSTRYNKWSAMERNDLFQRLCYVESQACLIDGSLPKFSAAFEAHIAARLKAEGTRLADFFKPNGEHRVFYSRKVGYFLQVLDFEPLVLDGAGRRRPPSEFKELRFADESVSRLALCCLNSNLFYWFVTVFSDCRHVNKREVDAFPVDLFRLKESDIRFGLEELAAKLMDDLKRNSEERVMKFKHDRLTVQCIVPRLSKPIIDEIDSLLAQHYGLSDDDLDFIINYEAKYRMGSDAVGDDDG